MLQSQLFTKTLREDPKDEVAKNAKLLIRAGFIHKEMAGVYSWLPLGLRVLRKLENIIREEMDNLGAQEVWLSALQPKENWRLTGRWDTMDDLFKLTDQQGKEMALGPTHEETITPLAKNFLHSYQDLPLAVYQFQTKFRMEKRAKSGLLRGREFLMKDLYSFHHDEKELAEFYERVAIAYRQIFTRVGLSDFTFRTRALGGTFSQFSDEFQTLTPAGEDEIYLCRACRLAVNREVGKTANGQLETCERCGDRREPVKAIEVGNIFKLNDKFAATFGCQFRDRTGRMQTPLMGAYGLGLGRLIGALVETQADEHGLAWPRALAPFDVHLLELGRREEAAKLQTKRKKIITRLASFGWSCLVDDRPLSAGEKLADADLLGLPWRFVISPRLGEAEVEVKKRVVDSSGKQKNGIRVLTLEQLLPESLV